MERIKRPSGEAAASAMSVVLAAIRHDHDGVLTAETRVIAGADADAEAVHGLRSAWRRLRAALWLMAQLRPSGDLEQLRLEARHAARLLADVRSWDVFIAESLPIILVQAADPDGAIVIEAACRQRAAAFADAQTELRSVRTQQLHRDLREWADRPGLLRPSLVRPDPSLAEFATAMIARLHGRVKKRGRHFAALDQDHRHRLRLAAKLLRDGARIFAADPGIGKRGRRGLLHLSTLLDGLGHARDLFSEPALLAQVQSRGPMLCVRAVSADNGRALCGAWHDFEKAPLPWLKR